jgi:hypothetical protein
MRDILKAIFLTIGSFNFMVCFRHPMQRLMNSVSNCKNKEIGLPQLAKLALRISCSV